MSTPAPIAADEMAVIVQRAVNWRLPRIAETPQGGAFEMTAPATGQRFRVTVAEIPGWSDRMDTELAEALTEEAAR